MRIIVKGGVWKNTEDEILKAAVMKYGKNQWARISSLLVRKSSKQCKARWYEWLDPSIKKTEWNPEEDEKLLHLAKIMPTQWRTIAPIVGRTAAQCIDRYEKLLDMAQGKDETDPDDPRRLRPGEIDPNPEHRPARPDPIDMDEDEKEMLQEARARLANTKGKKAKRKARERQLEEARRLVVLQKKRELRAAGMNWHAPKKRNRGIDYDAEVPFERRAPIGAFDTREEDRQHYDSKKRAGFTRKFLHELDKKSKLQDEEDKQRADVARQRKERAKDLPKVMLDVNAMNDPQPVLKRQKLSLPAPQVSEHELEEIVKLGYEGDAAAGAAGAGAATDVLLDTGGAKAPTPTPVAAARTPAQNKTERILAEASQLAAMQAQDTPLVGGDNTPMHSMDYQGITPQRHVVATPNVVMSSVTPSRGAIGTTPARGAAASPGRTGAGESAAAEAAGADIKSALATLPAPRHSYGTGREQVTVEDIDEEGREPPSQQQQQQQQPQGEEEEEEEDAEDREEKERQRRDAAEARERKLRSQAVQRGLPRPRVVNAAAAAAAGDGQGSSPEELLAAETVRLLQHDAFKYPPEGVPERLRQKKDVPLAAVDEAYLEEARRVLQEEQTALVAEHGHDLSVPSLRAAWENCDLEIVWNPKKKAYGRASLMSRGDRIADLKSQFEVIRKQIARDAKRAGALEKKLGLLTRGYEARHDGLATEIGGLIDQADAKRRELESFEALEEMERDAAFRRREVAARELAREQAAEGELQDKYVALLEQVKAATKSGEEAGGDEGKMEEEETAKEVPLASQAEADVGENG